MSALFQLPKQVPLSGGNILPGAKLTFSQTGTSTLQNTYQDEDLTTPHANPVVADANGVFEPIYLDPTLPHYRVRLTTAADVLVYQVDDVPSNQNVQQSMRLESAAPHVLLYETDGSSNQRKYKVGVSGSNFQFSGFNDAENVETVFFEVRSGFTPSARFLAFPEGARILDDGAYYPVTFQNYDPFDGTLTGMAASTVQGVAAARVGRVVTIAIPSAADGFTGTSNATSMTITGMPEEFWPTTTQTVPFPAVVDNGNLIGDGEQVAVQISTSGVITFLINRSSSGFTASGTKSTADGGTISYLIV